MATKKYLSYDRLKEYDALMKAEIAEAVSTKADTSHNHDSAYDVKGASTTAVDTHNVATDAHNDIRVLITELTTKLNNFLDVDDTTSDQLSEVLTLIDNNKGTLESLTTSKVNVADIIDNLTTASADKVLSAKQGVAIKELIDALQEAVDGKAASVHTHAISDVTNLQTTLDAKATQENLDSHTSNTDIHITSDERTAWNAIEENVKTYADGLITNSVADWNQNDESAPDYVKNRFGGYYENVYSTVFEEATVDFTFNENINQYRAWLDGEFVLNLVDSSTVVKVVFDGVEYIKAFDDHFGFEPDDTIPFGFKISVAEPIELKIYTTIEGDTHTVEISKVEKYPIPIDEKFLPDTVATKADIEAAIGNAIGGSY